MNKSVIFIGPSLQGFEVPEGITVLPPAQQGDITGMVASGVETIILVDGFFTQHLAPWHKEILFAIEGGCRVIGGGSLGAIRAAECHRYGMEPVGVISSWYASGVCYDDSEVALLHGPIEDGAQPLTVPLVNIRASAIELEKQNVVTSVDWAVDKFRSIHYTERSWKRMRLEEPVLATLIESAYIDQKEKDAHQCIEALFLPKNERRDVAKNPFNDYMRSLAGNDIRLPGQKRPWETVSDNDTPVDFWLFTEMAMALGVKVDESEILSQAQKMWAKLGISSENEAKSWMESAKISNSQFNQFAVRLAIKAAAKNWFTSVSKGHGIVPISREYQLLTNNLNLDTLNGT